MSTPVVNLSYGFATLTGAKYTVMKFLLVVTLVLFVTAIRAQQIVIDSSHRIQYITDDSAIVRPGQYELIEVQYIKRGYYNLILQHRGIQILVPMYSSHTWKKKTKFHKYYSINSYGQVKVL